MKWKICQKKNMQLAKKKKNQSDAKQTLKGSLSVLKLIPGTYFNQTGNPLQKKNKIGTSRPIIIQKKKNINAGSREG